MEKLGVEVLWTARFDYAKGQKFDFHFHDFYQIIYFLDGQDTFWCDHTAYRFNPGDLIYIKPGCRHKLSHDSFQPLKTLDIKFIIADKEMSSIFSAIGAFNCNVPSETMQLLEKIRTEGLDKKPHYKTFANLYLLEILYILLRENNGTAVQTPAAADARIPDLQGTAASLAKRYIREHYHEELSLEDISSHIGYSTSYISQSFKEAYKYTISAFLKRVRIEKAKEWMAYSEYSLKQIAEYTGFKNIHHFSRIFKETEGVSPGKWCSREKKGIRKDIFFDSEP